MITEFQGTDGATRVNFNQRIQEANAHISDQTIHMIALACTKSGTVYALTGLTATAGKVPVMFKANVDYVAGDTITIDGTAYALIVRTAKALTDGAWRAEKIITGVVDIDTKKMTVEPSVMPNPMSLNIIQGYGGQTGSYDGSATLSVSIPKVTISTAAPTATLDNGELWGVY